MKRLVIQSNKDSVKDPSNGASEGGTHFHDFAKTLTKLLWLEEMQKSDPENDY